MPIVSFDDEQEYPTLLEELESDENDKLELWAKWLVDEKARFRDGTKRNLNGFFGSTLAYRQDDRELKLDKLVAS